MGVNRHPCLATPQNHYKNMMVSSHLKALALLVGLVMNGSVFADFSRQYIHVVGASGTLPIARMIGSRLEKNHKLKQLPRLESTGTRGGITLFCESSTPDAPDVLVMARPLRKKEFDTCQQHGVRDIVEVRMGHDALVLVQSPTAAALPLTRHDLREALKPRIPAVADQSRFIANTVQDWRDINPLLPPRKIRIIGPPVLSGTAETLLEISGVDALPCSPARPACASFREDGTYQAFREHDEAIIAELVRDPEKIAVIDYKLYLDHRKKIQVLPLEGIKPAPDTLASASYPAVRTLYLYVKAAQVGKIPGLDRFLTELIDEKTWGDKGYLTELGLVPLAKAERQSGADRVKRLEPLVSPSE